MRRWWQVGAGLAVAVGVMLAVPSPAHGQEPEKKPKRIQYQRDKITREEIDERAADAKTAYDVVSRLRSQFLRPRPSNSIQNRTPVPIKVFVDGMVRGGVASLNDINATNIALIEWMSGTDATTRYGTGYESGAILVKTGR